MREIKKPTPFVYPEQKTFWEGTKVGEFRIQRCKDCKKVYFYPRTSCPHCLSENTEWIKASGKGKVYSYTIAHRAGNPAFANEVPYNIAMIDLDEGVRLTSTVIECKNEDIKIGMPVEVVFENVAEDAALPKFKPVKK